MKKRDLFITEFDKKRLEELIAVAMEFDEKNRHDLDDLATELNRGKLVNPEDVPDDVVTMNSEVLLRDADTSEKMKYRLVFPTDADIDSGAISILAPIGTAILGYRVGDVVEWSVPSGLRHIKIEKLLYQPEASKDFHL